MSCLRMGRIYYQDSRGDQMSKTLCWGDDDDNQCYWQKSWSRLYRNVCDFAREKGILSELLDFLENEDGEEE